MVTLKMQLFLPIAIWAVVALAQDSGATFLHPPDAAYALSDSTEVETFTVGQNATLEYIAYEKGLQLFLKTDNTPDYHDSLLLDGSPYVYPHVYNPDADHTQLLVWFVDLRHLPGAEDSVNKTGVATAHLTFERKDTEEVARSHQFRIINPATPPPTPGAPPADKSIIGGAVGGTVGFSLVLAAIGAFQYRRRRTKLLAATGSIEKGGNHSKPELEANEPPVEIEGGIPSQELDGGSVPTTNRSQLHELP